MRGQAGLFDAGPTLFADDDAGRIEYRPDLLDQDEAAHAFDDVLAFVDWRHEERAMYGRDVAVPRLMASFRLDDPAMPASIARLALRVGTVIDAPFNAVGLNLYRDANDSVAPHNDHLDEIVAGQPIALVSLGATREMVIRRKRPPRLALRLQLAPGSLLLMSHETQRHYDHGIPKMRTVAAPRISLVFRVRRG